MLRRRFMKLGVLGFLKKTTNMEQSEVPLFFPTYKWLHEKNENICWCICELSSGTAGGIYALKYDHMDWICRVLRCDKKVRLSSALLIFKEGKWTPIDHRKYYDHNDLLKVAWPTWLRKF